MEDRKTPIARWSWAVILAATAAKDAAAQPPGRRTPRPAAGLHAPRPLAPDVPPHGPHAPGRLHRLSRDLHRAAIGRVRQPAICRPGFEGRHTSVHRLSHRLPAGHRSVLADRCVALQPHVWPAGRLVRADLRRMDSRSARAGRVAPAGDPGDVGGGRSAHAGRAGRDRALAVSGRHGGRCRQQHHQHHQPRPSGLCDLPAAAGVLRHRWASASRRFAPRRPSPDFKVRGSSQ